MLVCPSDARLVCSPGPGYETVMEETAYSISMRLTIRSVAPSDFGEYKCVSKNYLGETEQSIKVDRTYTLSASFLSEFIFKGILD